MEFVASKLTQDAAYRLMSGTVLPRPIAWWINDFMQRGRECRTFPLLHQHHTFNSPPMATVNCACRKDGSYNDTPNAAASGDFVINVVSEDLAAVMHEMPAHYPASISKTQALGIAVAPSRSVKPPSIARSPITLECRRGQILEFGSDGHQNLVGEVVHFYVADHLMTNAKIDQTKVRPLARFGGPLCGRAGPARSHASL